MKHIGAAILGGTGYGAGELLRFLCVHPGVEVVSVVSSSSAGMPVAAVHSHLRGFCSLSFAAELDIAALTRFAHRVVFAALPHAASSAKIAQLMPQLEASGVKVIDLSGDLRLRDETVRKRHYPDVAAAQSFVDRFTYGLTELERDALRSSAAVANPGCLASACILAAAPLVRGFEVEVINFDAKTGTSGAGRSPKTEFHHPEAHSNAWAYKVLEHRHEPEILQALQRNGTAQELEITFVPHVIPLTRGIYATAHAVMRRPAAEADIRAAYRSFYSGSPFIRLLDGIPQLHAVLLSNFCDIGIRVRGRHVAAIAALDNLVKGMAGQAIQNMNVICGLPEESGLWIPAGGPV